MMEEKEITKGLETGLKLLSDPSFNALTNSKGLESLKTLIIHLLQGELVLTKAMAPAIPPIMPTAPPVAAVNK